MKKFLTTNIGRLRLFALLEGFTLLLLVFIAVPVKYYLQDPAWVKFLGPVHGGLFVLFVFNTISTSIEQSWKFSQITWKVLVACFIPFGTFYIDRKILKRMQDNR